MRGLAAAAAAATAPAGCGRLRLRGPGAMRGAAASRAAARDGSGSIPASVGSPRRRRQRWCRLCWRRRRRRAPSRPTWAAPRRAARRLGEGVHALYGWAAPPFVVWLAVGGWRPRSGRHGHGCCGLPCFTCGGRWGAERRVERGPVGNLRRLRALAADEGRGHGEGRRRRRGGNARAPATAGCLARGRAARACRVSSPFGSGPRTRWVVGAGLGAGGGNPPQWAEGNNRTVAARCSFY